ncbi:MAG: hypothetical protein E6G14_03595 [Actinobacteria bacterium]|nr:MAG: hypothetical protein E6G14_03595 [Actinomycetota bacterium]
MSRRPRRSRGRRIARAALLVVAVGVAFGLGVALGKALNDGPKTPTSVTHVRTLEPLPQRPAGSTTPR